MLGDGDVTGSEDYDLAVWISRVHRIFAAIPSLLFLTGVDVKTMAITLSGSRTHLFMKGRSELDIEILIGKALYWYLVPIFQLVCALVVADASMYCLHRLVHTNKWMYSKSSSTLPPKPREWH